MHEVRQNMSKPKKLITVGNSFALTIEKTVVRALGLDTESRFRMHLDDNRIVFEPIPTTSPPPLDLPHVWRSLQALINRGLTPEDFLRLSHDGTPLFRFMSRLSINDRRLDRVTCVRIEKCLKRRTVVEPWRRNESWNETIEAVLAQVAGPLHGVTSTVTAAASPGAPVESPTPGPSAEARAFVRELLTGGVEES